MINIEHLKEKGMDIAVISSDEKVIVDIQSVLDLAMTSFLYQKKKKQYKN